MRTSCLARFCLAGLSAVSAADNLALIQFDVQPHGRDASTAGAILRNFGMQMPEGMELPNNMTMEDLMGFANELLAAFKNDTFVSALKSGFHHMADHVINFTNYTIHQQQALARAASGNKTRDQVIELVKDHFRVEAQAMLSLARQSELDVQSIVAALPAGNLRTFLQPQMEKMHEMLDNLTIPVRETVDEIVLASAPEFCSKVTPFFRNNTKLEVMLRSQVLPQLNNSGAQIDGMKSMIEAFAPDVADTVVSFMHEAADTSGDIVRSYHDSIETSESSTGQIVQDKLRCSMDGGATGAGARAGPGLLAAVLALAVWFTASAM